MAESRGFDTCSALLGAFLGIVCLLALAGLRDRAGGPGEAPEAGATVETSPSQRPRGEAAAWMAPARPSEIAAMRQRLERSLERRAQEHLDSVIGKNRSIVSLTVTNWGEGVDAPVVEGLSMALSIDATKVTHDPHTGRFEEIERPQPEIDILAQLAMRAAGLEEGRGDRLTVFSLRFDKSQEIATRELAVADSRRSFWGSVAKAAVALLAFGLIIGGVSRRSRGEGHLRSAEMQIAAFVSAGAVLGAGALGVWGGGFGWREIAAFFGLFMVLAGLLGAVRWVRAPADSQEE